MGRKKHNRLVPSISHIITVCMQCINFMYLTFCTAVGYSCVSEDEFSVQAMIAINVGIFIITFIVATIISIIVTSLFCKHHDRSKEDSEAAGNNINSLITANIKVDPNPAYETIPISNPPVKRSEISNAAYIRSSEMNSLNSLNRSLVDISMDTDVTKDETLSDTSDTTEDEFLVMSLNNTITDETVGNINANRNKTLSDTSNTTKDGSLSDV